MTKQHNLLLLAAVLYMPLASASTIEFQGYASACTGCSARSAGFTNGFPYVVTTNFGTNEVSVIPLDSNDPPIVIATLSVDLVWGIAEARGDFVLMNETTLSGLRAFSFLVSDPENPQLIESYIGYRVTGRGINSSGTVVGSSDNKAIISDQNGTRLLVSPFGVNALAYDISENGNMVVGAVSNSEVFLATVWVDEKASFLRDDSGNSSGTIGFANVTTNDGAILGYLNGQAGFWETASSNFTGLYADSSPSAAAAGFYFFNTPNGCVGWRNGIEINISAAITAAGGDVEGAVCNGAVSDKNGNLWVTYNHAVVASLTVSNPDIDGDGISDSADNCTTYQNVSQLDSDSDGYGNACDTDFNNDCIVNFLDVVSFSDEFLGTSELFDVNEDGVVNFVDFSVLSSFFLLEPGPSGLPTACD